jgi:hypothetical protein
MPYRSKIVGAILSLIAVLGVALGAQPVCAADKHQHLVPKRRHYFSPDRQMRAVIVADDPQPHRRAAESRVLIYRSNGTIASAVDYSSPDGAHGFGVVKAAWTPDSQFFVYSMTSSGGHQPWKSPTYFYSRKNNKTQGIEQTLGKPVLSPDFTLSAPATVTIATWRKPPLDTDAEIAEDLRLGDVAYNPAAQPIQPRTLATPAPW